MLNLITGNRRYSSWSLRGWLAVRHSGLTFTETVVDIFADDWQQRRRQPDIAVSGGIVPILWDGERAVWNAMAIIVWLDHLSGGTRLWPQSADARAFALSAAAEMQAGFIPLRSCCPMNFMRHYPGFALTPGAEQDVARIGHLWTTALTRFGGPWLGGAEFSGVDIMYAPIASRFTTYDVALPAAADAYRRQMMAHPLMAQWQAMAASETRLNPECEF